MSALLQDYASRQAERRPQEPAVVMGDEILTYLDLEESSNRLARLLRESGCRPGDRVCLFLSKTPAAVVAMHAVLKAGCAYVPIDLASPAPRVAMIVESADPRLVLAEASAAALVDELVAGGQIGDSIPVGFVGESHGGAERFDPAFDGSDAEGCSKEPPPRAGSPSDLAHILFTSGSTGTPKGVVITHDNVVAFVEWALAEFGTRPSDRISGHPPLHFDLSTFDIYATLAAGARLHMVPASANLLPGALADFIRGQELTQWFSVPSTLTFMAKFDVVSHGDFPALERLLWCGEVLPTPILMHWMERLPHVRFTNLYGPTEATIASSYFHVPERPGDETEPVPIGVPCAGEELLVLDGDLRPAEPGQTGELFIAGVGLSPGYWRDPDKTAAAFVPDPRSEDPSARIYRTGDLARVGEDGVFHFLGRADTQIKSRGYRIELGEIETALNALDGLREGAIVAVPTEGFENMAICCAFAPMDDETSPERLRARLAESLPAYMLPSRWMAFEVLPKNVNGKIDRKRLREAFEERALR